MRRLIIAVAVATLLGGYAYADSLHDGRNSLHDSPNSLHNGRNSLHDWGGSSGSVSSPTYRVCIRGTQNRGLTTRGDVIFCATCQLKAGSLFSESGCKDFYNAESALAYWNSLCCD